VNCGLQMMETTVRWWDPVDWSHWMDSFFM